MTAIEKYVEAMENKGEDDKDTEHWSARCAVL